MIITIDGPVASGKSTIARMLAHELGYFYLYTGLLYRAVAYLLIQEGIEFEAVSENKVKQLISKLMYAYDGKEHIFFDSKEITDQLSTPAVGDAASRISAIPFVRKYLNTWQRQLAKDQPLVADGRDSGSVVFPHADVKFFLTAPVAVRAERWREKQQKHGKWFTVEQALQTIQERDERDANRSIDPLIVPEGAIVISNEGKTPQETANELLQYIKE